MATFAAIPFQAEYPEFAEGRVPEARIAIDNVARELLPHIERAMIYRADLIAIYREYRSDDVTVPCYGPVEFVIRIACRPRSARPCKSGKNRYRRKCATSPGTPKYGSVPGIAGCSLVEKRSPSLSRPSRANSSDPSGRSLKSRPRDLLPEHATTEAVARASARGPGNTPGNLGAAMPISASQTETAPTTHTWHAVPNPRMRNCSTVANRAGALTPAPVVTYRTTSLWSARGKKDSRVET